MTEPGSIEELLEKCRESALRLLEQRLHSRAELDRKLRERGYPTPVRTVILADLERVGLVDDQQFAEAFIRQKLGSSRPVGRQRILLDLRRRGVPAELAENTYAEIAAEDGDDDSELERARAAAERKWASLVRSGREYQKARASLYRFLASRGFSGDIVRRILDDLSSPNDPD